MNTDWLQFLEQQGARIEAGDIVDFGDANAEREAVDGDLLMPLSRYGLIQASGSDTAEFLQGQFGNDVRKVDAGHHQLNSYSSPKGRMLALFRLSARDEGYLLRLPTDTLEAALKRLSMFVLRSQVVLSEASELVGLGLSGPNAAKLLDAACGGVPKAAGEARQNGELSLLRVPGDQPRFEVYGPVEAMRELWNRLAESARPAGAPLWALLEIRAGLPTLYAANAEAFVAQMLNMQLIDGVNFKKGCYPGQEVVARMQYLGKLKRRMYRARVDAACPAAGDELFSPESASGQGAGRVVDAAPNADGCELLLVAEVAVAEGGTLRLDSNEGTPLQLLELPYPFEAQEA